MYLKNKPQDIELEEKWDIVPRRFVLNEVQEYFDEFGSNVGKLYAVDENHCVNYVKHHLKEEFAYEQIEDPRTTWMIKKIFMEVWDSKIPPKSLQDICDDLIRENPEAGISDLMKAFARKYPCKKRQSRQAYNILASVKKRC